MRKEQRAWGPLETSLVEWKPVTLETSDKKDSALGNFLSGMETNTLKDDAIRFWNLGNFLSGMETWRRQLWKIGETVLGNFLSGMETRGGSECGTACLRLGNFLSGMETSGQPTALPVRTRPWKLP